jgi:hypothetical protein
MFIIIVTVTVILLLDDVMVTTPLIVGWNSEFESRVQCGCP